MMGSLYGGKSDQNDLHSGPFVLSLHIPHRSSVTGSLRFFWSKADAYNTLNY